MHCHPPLEKKVLTSAYVSLLMLLLPCAASGQDFVNIVDQANPIIVEHCAYTYAGCAWVDYDGDGWLDLVMASNVGVKLFKNNRGVFTAMPSTICADTASCRGIGWADYDNDGDLDVFAANNQARLYRNDGADFAKVADGLVGGGGDNSGWSTAWGDYDSDGFVDLIITFPDFMFPPPARPNRMLRNLGPPDYELALMDTGVVTTGIASYSSANWSDFDLDGDLDLFVGCSPAAEGEAGPDRIYRNMLVENGAVGFEIMTNEPATDIGDGQMWNIIDWDNDGDMDLFRTNWGGDNPDYRQNDVYVNDGGVYTEDETSGLVTHPGGPRISLSSVWGDFDNDGDQDCFVANVDGDHFYRNEGGGLFIVPTDAGDMGDGVQHSGASAGDYDNDGDLDLYAHGSSQELYRNDLTNGFSWLKIKLVGVLSNRAAIGAKIRAKATILGSPVWQWREISAQNTFCGHNSLIVHIGFGDAALVDSVQILWPSGVIDTHTDVNPGATLMATEGGALECLDSDADGHCDDVDNCLAASNTAQTDIDLDGIGDACDLCTDTDGDFFGDPGFPASTCPEDNCPDVYNPYGPDSDGDGFGDVCDQCPGFDDNADSDSDGWADGCDNCPEDYNPGQEDDNSDGVGDVCAGCCDDRVGDANGLGGDEPTIGDVSIMIDAKFITGTCDGILDCFTEADVNQSGGTDADCDDITIGDISTLIDYLFITGPPLGLPNCL